MQPVMTCLLLVFLPVAFVDVADVYLKDGRRLRGDIDPRAVQPGVDIELSNDAGSIVIPADLIDRVEFLEPSAATSTAPSDPSTAPAETDTGPAAADRPDEPLPPHKALTPGEILRLRLSELDLEGPAEDVRVRFINKANQLDVTREAYQELARKENTDPEMLDRLENGTPQEKLQALVRGAGLKYADRIELFSDPKVFQSYRRPVLQVILRGCSGSGCHTGPQSKVFRFPMGEKNSDAFVYTSFAMLDGMTVNGMPMIDRELPEQSVLVKYLLPYEPPPRKVAPKDGPFDESPAREEPADVLHPPVIRGRPIPPALRGTRDPNYLAIIDWINSLRTPRPDYPIETVKPMDIRSKPADNETAETQPSNRNGE